jgi:ATP/maltotriose-dependent transcriptional regulator MalT
VLLVIDDLHTLEGQPAESALERLVVALSPAVRILAASRSQPRMNLSRLRVAGELLEISADDLRFRSWEVERLFRDHYRQPMPPEELAHLARWTEGWAAGLQLFHLATEGRPPDERRRLLGLLGPRSRLAREYLAQNALERLPDELRDFLVGTSVLGRLSGRLCDHLLGRTGSAAMLEELERRCLFTTRLSDGELAITRSSHHLLGVLLADLGEDRLRSRLVAAGELLALEGAKAEALDAFARAEAWHDVERMLANDGQAIAAESPDRLGSLTRLALVDDARLAWQVPDDRAEVVSRGDGACDRWPHPARRLRRVPRLGAGLGRGSMPGLARERPGARWPCCDFGRATRWPWRRSQRGGRSQRRARGSCCWRTAPLPLYWLGW